MLYLITDTHIGHKGIIKMQDRPNNFERMIFANWKNMVKANDTVIHLGDIAWGEDNLKKVMKLPGRKVLVKGNHDKKSLLGYMEDGFSLAANEIRMSLEGVDVLFTHRPATNREFMINIHGHVHSLFRENLNRLYLPLSLEHMGYRPIPVDHVFMKTIRSWVDRDHIPSIEEIIALKQDYIGHPIERDFIDYYKDSETEDMQCSIE